MALRDGRAFTLVEVMIVIAIIGILVAISTPNGHRVRPISKRNCCQENLSKIDGAKQQFAVETKKPPGYSPRWSDLVGTDNYIRKSPECPGGGTYTMGRIGENPSCSLRTLKMYPHVFVTGS